MLLEKDVKNAYIYLSYGLTPPTSIHDGCSSLLGSPPYADDLGDSGANFDDIDRDGNGSG